MKKDELISKIAEKANLSKKDADAAVKAFTETVQEVLAAGDTITLVGFGTFTVKKRAARNGKNPRTGEMMQIAACNAPTFKAGRVLKDAVNG